MIDSDDEEEPDKARPEDVPKDIHSELDAVGEMEVDEENTEIVERPRKLARLDLEDDNPSDAGQEMSDLTGAQPDAEVAMEELQQEADLPVPSSAPVADVGLSIQEGDQGGPSELQEEQLGGMRIEEAIFIDDDDETPATDIAADHPTWVTFDEDVPAVEEPVPETEAAPTAEPVEPPAIDPAPVGAEAVAAVAELAAVAPAAVEVEAVEIPMAPQSADQVAVDADSGSFEAEAEPEPEGLVDAIFVDLDNRPIIAAELGAGTEPKAAGGVPAEDAAAMTDASGASAENAISVQEGEESESARREEARADPEVVEAQPKQLVIELD